MALFAAASTSGDGAAAFGENNLHIGADYFHPAAWGEPGVSHSAQPSARGSAGCSSENPVSGAAADRTCNGAPTWANAIASAHAMDHGAQYCDMRGKHSRDSTQKTVPWPVTAEAHMAKIRNASLLGEARCSDDCTHQKQCMISAFTVTTLRKCATLVFGESVLDGKEPTTRKHDVTHIWFNLIFQCRVCNFEGIVERIEFAVDGRRVCEGAFAAVYAIQPTTLRTLKRHVLRGDHRYVTFASTRTCSRA
eukprot:3013097-Pleurochrysis_carterae.AAC.1